VRETNIGAKRDTQVVVSSTVKETAELFASVIGVQYTEKFAPSVGST
jgi:hypothetical protein